MNTQRSPYTINNDLYQLYTDIQLRDIENDATMSSNEKKQLKAILMSVKKIDGNISYPIFQEIFQNSIGYKSANNQEQLVASTNSIEQDVIDTGITRSDMAVSKSHQTHGSTSDQTSSNEGILQIIEYQPATTRSQLANTGNHITSSGSYPTDIEVHTASIRNYSESTESRTTMNLATLEEKDKLPPPRKTHYWTIRKCAATITSLKGLKDADFSKQPLEKILLPTPREEMRFIKAHFQRSCVIFRMRMQTVNELRSAEDKAFLETFDVRDVMQIYKKPMSEFISLLANRYKPESNKCRQMLCAYQIGKITDQLLRESSHEGNQTLEDRLFRHLKVAIAKNHISYHNFVNLCVNSLYLVEHVGVHALFVPEVISPAILKELNTGSLLSLVRHMAVEWPPQFRKLARSTYYGEVVVSRAHNDDSNVQGETVYPGRFLNRF